MRWNEEQSIQMQEERNRVRHYMQELRVQIAQAMTGDLNKDHMDSVAKAVSLDELISLNLPQTMAPNIAAEMMAHDDDDDVLMDPIDSSMIPATLIPPEQQSSGEPDSFSISKAARSSTFDEIDNDDMQHPQIQTHARASEKVTYDSNNQAGSSSNADIVHDRGSLRGEALQHPQAKYPPTTIKKSSVQASGKSRLRGSIDENESLQVMKDAQFGIGEQSRKRKQSLQTKNTDTGEMISKGKRKFGEKSSN